jgi:hypothetical protein
VNRSRKASSRSFQLPYVTIPTIAPQEEDVEIVRFFPEEETIVMAIFQFFSLPETAELHV